MIEHAIAIDASALSSLDVNANNSSRVFYIGGDVTLSGLTITGGLATEGGGIFNDGSLTLTHSTLVGNSANYVGRWDLQHLFRHADDRELYHQGVTQLAMTVVESPTAAR